MPEYLAPGVYVEEVPSGPVPIAGVSTSNAGFVGVTERGPLMPRLVTSWSDYESWFGGLLPPTQSYMPWAVKGFFDNGGQRLFVARVVVRDTANGGADAADAAAQSFATGSAQTVDMISTGPGVWGNRIFVRISDGSNTSAANPTVRVTLLYYRVMPPMPGGDLVDPLDPANIANPDRREPSMIEDFDSLGTTPTSSDFFFDYIPTRSRLVELDWGDPTIAADRPTNTTGFVQLATTANDGAVALTLDDFQGLSTAPPGARTGIAGLADIDEISILAAPDATNPLILDAPGRGQLRDEIINQCEILRDRFAVTAAPNNDDNPAAMRPPRDSSYAAYYTPRIRVFDPATGGTHLVTPVGHIAGVYARTDVLRGVHKVPANEVVRGMVTTDINATRKPLEYTFGKREQDILNPKNVNVIRDFRADGRGIRVYGGRTMSSDATWLYINVRRLLLYIEESIDEGTQWVVFEPNDEPLWARVRQSVRNFLLLTWRTGALQGQKEEEAFFVRCDRSTMTQADIDAGRLICQIGVAPVKPAEYVIFRIQLNTATE